MSALSKKLESYIEIYSAMHLIGRSIAGMADVFNEKAFWLGLDYQNARLILLSFLIKQTDEQFAPGNKEADPDVLISKDIIEFRIFLNEGRDELAKMGEKN